MTSVKYFYSKNFTPHRFLPEAITQIEQNNFDAADFVMVGPPPRGLDSEVEEDNENNLNVTYLPKVVTGEVEVFL